MLNLPRVSCFVKTVVAASLLATGLHAHADRGDSTVPGEVLVKLRSTAALDPLLAKYGLAVLDSFGSRPIYRLKVPDTVSVGSLISAFSTEADVLIAEPNTIHSTPEARKNVVWAIGTPAAYAAQWAPAAMHLADAQRISTGAGVRVAVLDTGVDTQHPALAGRLVPGFDFVDFDADPSEVGDPSHPGFGHGTHVAGLVALVAPGATIMPLRVLDADGQGNSWVLAEALLYAVDPDGDPSTDDGAQIINMSLGSTTRTRIIEQATALATCMVPAGNDPANDFSDPAYDADEARCKNFAGVVIVAAAGNSGSGSEKQYPAAENAHGLIAVGASGANSRLAGFSNFGSWIGITAPGDGITSTVPGGGYATWSGTSMAAPLITGTAALLRSARPDLRPDEVLRRMTSRSVQLCGSNMRQIDAAATLLDKNPPALSCR